MARSRVASAPPSSAPTSSAPRTPREQAPWAERHFWPVCAGILLVSLLARVGLLTEYVSHNPLAAVPLNDAQTYWDWAGEIASGRWSQTTPFFSAPLYPFLLGLLRACGASLTSIYVLQMLADLTTAALLAWVCRGRFGAGVGLLAAAVYLLLQEPASFSLRILSTSVQLLVVTVAWAALVAVQARPTIARHIAVGAALGLLCLIYPAALVLIPIVAVWLVVQSAQRGRAAARALLAVAIAGLVIAPATIHNWRANHELTVIQAGGGVTLFQGNQPRSDGVYTRTAGISTEREQAYADAARLYRSATGQEPTWAAVDRYFRDRVLEYWRADPRRAVALAARKLYWFLSGQNYGDIYQPNSEIAAGQMPWLRLASLPTAWLVGPALVGLVLLLRHPVRNAPEWLLLLLPMAIVMAFFFSPRYRAPAAPLLVVAAAYAVERALHWRTHARLAVVTAVALLVSLALGPLNRACTFDLLDRSSAYFNLAAALDRLGQFDAAVQNWRVGLTFVPGRAVERIALGDVLSRRGRLDEAIAEYQSARALTPDDPELLGRIGKTLVLLGRAPEAELVLAEASAKFPADAILLGLLADAKAMQGQTDAAAVLSARAVAMAPADGRLHLAYGRLLVRLQRGDEALRELTRALETGADPFEALTDLGRLKAQRGDFESAWRDFQRALVARPRSVQTIFDLGALHFNNGRPAEAVEYFRQALALDPNDAKCRAALLQAEQAQRRGAGPPP